MNIIILLLLNAILLLAIIYNCDSIYVQTSRLIEQTIIGA